MLIHPGSFDVRALTEHPLDHLFLSFRQHIFSQPPAFQKAFIRRLYLIISCRHHRMAFSNSLISLYESISSNQYFFLSHRSHRFSVKFHSLQRNHAGASPIEINSAVIILKKIRIPKSKCPLYFFIWPVYNIFCPIITTV